MYSTKTIHDERFKVVVVVVVYSYSGGVHCWGALVVVVVVVYSYSGGSGVLSPQTWSNGEAGDWLGYMRYLTT